MKRNIKENEYSPDTPNSKRTKKSLAKDAVASKVSGITTSFLSLHFEAASSAGPKKEINLLKQLLKSAKHCGSYSAGGDVPEMPVDLDLHKHNLGPVALSLSDSKGDELIKALANLNLDKLVDKKVKTHLN